MEVLLQHGTGYEAGGVCAVSAVFYYGGYGYGGVVDGGEADEPAVGFVAAVDLGGASFSGGCYFGEEDYFAGAVGDGLAHSAADIGEVFVADGDAAGYDGRGLMDDGTGDRVFDAVCKIRAHKVAAVGDGGCG